MIFIESTSLCLSSMLFPPSQVKLQLKRRALLKARLLFICHNVVRQQPLKIWRSATLGESPQHPTLMART